MDMEYMLLPIIWLVLLIVFAVIEFLTQGIATVWFAVAAGVALLLALIGAPLWLQIVVFVFVSLALLIFIRDILVKRYNKSLEKTNVEAVVGEHAVVIEAINNVAGTGRVIIKGMEWSAATENDGTVFDTGAAVTVVDVKGVKVIVR